VDYSGEVEEASDGAREAEQAAEGIGHLREVWRRLHGKWKWNRNRGSDHLSRRRIT